MKEDKGHPARQVETPRKLNVRERDVLRAVLGFADFDGRDALLKQIDSAVVVGRCRCGCATVDLSVDGQPRGGSVSRPIPNQANVVGPRGEGIGGVLVFVAVGKLASLEVYSNSNTSIDPLPPAADLDIYQLPL